MHKEPEFESGNLSKRKTFTGINKHKKMQTASPRELKMVDENALKLKNTEKVKNILSKHGP